MRNTFVAVCSSLIGFIICSSAFAVERVTPYEWLDKISAPTLDQNGNFVEDVLENIASSANNPNALADTIVALKNCPSNEELQEIEQYGDVEYVGRSLTLVHLTRACPHLSQTHAQAR